MRILISVALVSVLVAACKKEEPKAAPGAAVAPVTAPAAPGIGAPPGAAATVPAQPAAPAAQPGAPNDLGQALANLQKLGAQFGNQPGAPGANPQNPGASLSAAMQQLGKAMGAGSANQGGGPTVNWKSLEPFVPEQLGDWTAQGAVKGETSAAMGMQLSRVKRRYKKGDGSLAVEIIDTNASPIMRMGISMAASLNIDGSDGVKKGVTVGGHKGLLEWKKGNNSGKLTLLVGERYLLSLRLRPAASADDVQAVGNLVNTSGLAALK